MIRPSRVLAITLGMVTLGVIATTTAGPALAFGTYNSPSILGQQAEHERITRVLANNGFEPKTLDLLAGTSGKLGAVGAPDDALDSSSIPGKGLGPGEKHSAVFQRRQIRHRRDTGTSLRGQRETIGAEVVGDHQQNVPGMKSGREEERSEDGENYTALRWARAHRAIKPDSRRKVALLDLILTILPRLPGSARSPPAGPASRPLVFTQIFACPPVSPV